MLTALDSISQTSADTVCLPISQLKTAINKIEEGKVVAKELALLKQNAHFAERRIIVKDSLILVYQKNEGNYRRLINNYEANIASNAIIVGNLEKGVKYYKKIARRQKLQKWVVAALGISLGYLIAK